MSGQPLLWLVIGPNGAGKTTYYETRIQPSLQVEFVNADLIATERWPASEEDRSYEAAKLAADRRTALIGARRSFAAETVFSHPSKLDLVRAALEAGYEVWVTFIHVSSPDLCVARVRARVQGGGHDVPEEKIRTRFTRMPDLAREAIALASRSFVVDNSDPRRPLRDVLSFERGRVRWRSEDLPSWCLRGFAAELAGTVPLR